MTTSMIIEAVGYIGSLLVVVSMLMTSVMKLRIFNMTGSIIFAVYALIIHSYPTAFMNFALVIINIVNMRKLAKTSKHYSMVESQIGDSFVNFFISKYSDDIKNFFADGFSGNEEVAFLICNDDTPVGIMAGQYIDSNTFKVAVDYTTPMFRDCSVGEYLYPALKAKGIKKVILENASDAHKDYLGKMNYINDGSQYIKVL